MPSNMGRARTRHEQRRASGIREGMYGHATGAGAPFQGATDLARRGARQT